MEMQVHRFARSVLHTLPYNFEGNIYETSGSGLLVRISKDENGYRECWMFVKVRDRRNKGKSRIFPLGATGWVYGGLSPTRARELAFTYKTFYQLTLDLDDPKCLKCHERFERYSDSTFCYSCELRFRAKRLHKRREDRLINSVFSLQHLIKATKELNEGAE